MNGPLTGVRIIELAGIGPAPFAAMMLADSGAEVIRVERAGTPAGAFETDILNRSRRSIAVDLKTPEGVAIIRDLCRRADGVMEGFRPGVVERLGLGPDVLLGDNPALVYGRMTGWGQEGPYAPSAGHDINYIALAGNLHGYGRAGDKPTPPANAVGDFGGGGMMLAFGMVSAILHARATGQGQVIDCAMVDGAALINGMSWSFLAQGIWRDERGVNYLDTGAHFYDTYETADAKFVSIGSIEPQFYARLLKVLGLDGDPGFAAQFDPAQWPALRERLAAIFRTRTRDDWCALLEKEDLCFAPVLSMREAAEHPHNKARGTFLNIGGIVQPAPAPRYSTTPAARPAPPVRPGSDGAALLAELGRSGAEIAALIEHGVVGG